MNNKDLYEVIKNHKDETREAYSDGTIKDLQDLNSSKYERIEINFPWGIRRCLQKKSQKDYLLIQKARGGSVTLEEEVSIEEDLSMAKESLDKIKEIDKIRIEELDFLVESNILNLPKDAIFAELGFRSGKLLKYYIENYSMEAYGYDVIDSNVAVAKCLGFNALLYDFNDCSKELDLKNADLVVSYHMLEHVTNPFDSVKKIYESMKNKSYFHVEIPLEPNGPNIRYCHMYPFHQGDMLQMLQQSGFTVLTYNNKVQIGGPQVERYLAIKN
tara:strand:+ start:1045 stop:1860 length:816 start_codon:yes stop_codon:yes gene_type:complete